MLQAKQEGARTENSENSEPEYAYHTKSMNRVLLRSHASRSKRKSVFDRPCLCAPAFGRLLSNVSSCLGRPRKKKKVTQKEENTWLDSQEKRKEKKKRLSKKKSQKKRKILGLTWFAKDLYLCFVPRTEGKRDLL